MFASHCKKERKHELWSRWLKDQLPLLETTIRIFLFQLCTPNWSVGSSIKIAVLSDKEFFIVIRFEFSLTNLTVLY